MFSFVLIPLAYLLGAVPVGVILGRLRGTDPRHVGSGNIGATNVMRAAGKAMGIVTLLCDTAKGFVPVMAAIWLALDTYTVALTGFAAFLGHLYPVYLRFRGGKGIATSLGVFLALSPLAMAIDFAVFLVVILLWRYVSLASLAGSALLPLILILLEAPAPYAYLSLCVGVLVFWKHRENIARLRAGTEHRLGRSK